MAEPSSGWGWGAWGSSAISVFSDLQKAAVDAAGEISKTAVTAAKEAAKGVAEVKTSIADSPESDEEDIKKDDNLPEGSAENLETNSDQEKLRRAALEKLEGASRDSLLGHGLKAFDESVENLTLGAWQALGTAWKGGIDIVQKLELSAEHLSETLQKPGSLTEKAGSIAPSIIQSGKALTARGMEVLEFVGRETVELIASETGIKIDDSDTEEKPLKNDMVEAGELLIEDATFDHCFYIYGGPEQLEELESLSNHRALLCNRARLKLRGEQKAAFDALLKQLQETLTLEDDKDITLQDTNKGKGVEPVFSGNGNELEILRDSSISKAAEMAAGFTAALGGMATNELIQKTKDRLEAIRAEGVHRLSEVCALGVSHLLTMGRLVLSEGSSDDTDETVDGIVWPKDCPDKAKYIKAKAQAMAGDIEVVSNGFITGVGEVTAAFQAAFKGMSKDSDDEDVQQKMLKENTIKEKAQAVSGDLLSDASAAIEKMQDGLQYFAFILLSTSLKN